MIDKRMKGDLFSGKPLTVPEDPVKRRKAEGIAESLRVIHGGACAMIDAIWDSVYEKCGHTGPCPANWRTTVSTKVMFIQADIATVRKTLGHTAKKKETERMYRSDLYKYAKELLDD